MRIVLSGGPYEGMEMTSPEEFCPRLTLLKRGEQLGHGYIPTQTWVGESQVWIYDGQRN